MRQTGGLGADVVLEMAGHPSAIRTAFDIVRRGGRVSLLGLTSKPISLNFSEDIIFKGITVQGISGRRMYQTWYQMTALCAAACTSGRCRCCRTDDGAVFFGHLAPHVKLRWTEPKSWKSATKSSPGRTSMARCTEPGRITWPASRVTPNAATLSASQATAVTGLPRTASERPSATFSRCGSAPPRSPEVDVLGADPLGAEDVARRGRVVGDRVGDLIFQS